MLLSVQFIIYTQDSSDIKYTWLDKIWISDLNEY